MKSLFITICAAPLITLFVVSAAAATPEESFRKSFPGISAESIRPTAVSGLYEVTSGSRIVYYAPGPEYLIQGPIINKNRENITEMRITEIIGGKLKTIPLEKAIRIGTGTHQVVEITDPDCSFCRKASRFFANRNDITRHVFLLPASMHPNAKAKTLYIFCSDDKAKAYEEAMNGKLDDMKFSKCESTEAENLLKEHQEIGRKVGVTGTPLFLIDGQVVLGADIPRIEKMLKQNSESH
jgi:thiol:disulfide interchange protein DsbC